MPMSKMTAPLAGAVAFLLSSGAAAAVSSQVAAAINSMAGQTAMDCNKICAAAGQSNTGSTYKPTASVVEYTCGCSGGAILVHCTTSIDGQALLECCPAGTGCLLGNKPANLEQSYKNGVANNMQMEQLLKYEARTAQSAPQWAAGFHCPPCAGSKTQFSKSEILDALELHNRFRTMVGSGPLNWNCPLMCQAQLQADKCSFQHSDAGNSPIKAAENLASGTHIDVAAWMWFSEYGLAPAGEPAQGQSTAHYTAMVWKATADLGCGICRSGTGEIICQYANAEPNVMLTPTSFHENVPVFYGSPQEFQYGGFDIDVVKKLLNHFQAMRLPIGNALARFYDASADGSLEPSSQHNAASALTGCLAGGVLAMAAAAAVFAIKRGGRIGHRTVSTMNDMEDADTNLVEA